MNLKNSTIEEIQRGLGKKEFSAFELTKFYLDAIAEHDTDIGAYLFVDEYGALEQAKNADVRIAKEERLPPLTGVPMGIKDNILINGKPATAGSKILESYRAPYNATVVERLTSNGAVFLGKTNLDEFAMGTSTEHSAFHITKNPHDTTRVPGGSSGGSAAAVAANLAVAALGSDTGGSIRQPASFCGVVGLKPTYGAVSRFGLIALGSSLDQIGPLTKTVRDSRIIFDAIKGADPHDATSRQASTEPTKTHSLDKIKAMKIGLPEEYFDDGLAPEVRSAIEKSIADLKSVGISFKKMSLPNTKYAISAYYIIMPAEASTNLARYDNIRYTKRVQNDNDILSTYIKNRTSGFGEEARRRIMLGNFVLSAGHYDAYYKKAQDVRRLIRREFDSAFRDVDAILTPVTPTTAFKIGEKIEDPLEMYLADIFTVSANLSGLPGLSVPVRNSTNELPVNFQLIGNEFREDIILSIGEIYEQLHGIAE